MGDLLPSTIYISYLKMLQGLASGPQCAHCCFTLLKVNSSSHGKKPLPTSILFPFLMVFSKGHRCTTYT